MLTGDGRCRCSLLTRRGEVYLSFGVEPMGLAGAARARNKLVLTLSEIFFRVTAARNFPFVLYFGTFSLVRPERRAFLAAVA